jgi:hypothetical protein
MSTGNSVVVKCATKNKQLELLLVRALNGESIGPKLWSAEISRGQPTKQNANGTHSTL